MRGRGRRAVTIDSRNRKPRSGRPVHESGKAGRIGRFRRSAGGVRDGEQPVALIRDVFGNPFRALPVDPGWLCFNNGVVGKLARACYEERDPARLAVLADAPEDAGFADQDILAHCRSGGPHVRGCWVVDLLLGKR